MLDHNQAQKNLEKFVPDIIPKAWTEYKNLYLFRVELPTGELAYDPFFSVDVNTGEVLDFSILSDLDVIANLKWTEI